MTANNANLDIVNKSKIYNLVKFCQFVLKILSRNKILTSIKGHNSVTNLRKMTGNNPNLDIVYMKQYIKLGEFCQLFHKTLSGNEILK